MGNKSQRRAVGFIAFAASFLTPWMVSSVNIALPSIGRELSMGAVALSRVTSSYLLSTVVFLVPFGKIADIYGRKKIFLYGMVVITLSSLLSAIVFNGLLLILTRILHGIGAAMIFGTAMAMLTSVFPSQKRGRILGINMSFVYTGLMAGPVLGGIITRYLGWRMLFWLNLPVCIAVILVTAFCVRYEWKEKGMLFTDRAGAVLYGVILVLCMSGVARLSSTAGIVMVVLGLVCAVIFYRIESLRKSPVFPVDLFSGNRLFACSNFSALINYSATYALVFLMSLYLQYLKGLPPDRAGLIMIVQPVMMVLFSPLAGRLSDRYEPRFLASAGMGCTAAGLFALSFLSGETSYGQIIMRLIFVGLGFALFSSPNTSAALGAVERRHLGTATATIGTMRLIGQVLSMGIMMFVMSVTIGKGTIVPEQYPAFEHMMVLLLRLFTLLCIGGLILSALRGNVRGVS